MPDITQEKRIQKFLTDNPEPSKLQVYNFFDYHFINTEYYPEFVQQVLNNALDVTFQEFEKLGKKKKLFYLKSIANLIDVALSIKLWEFQLSRKDATWWWKGTTNYYLYPSGMIKSLEELRYNGLAYNEKSTHETTLAVEGASEFTFLKYIQENLGYANFNVDVYSYEGKGQIVSLARYINEKNRQGIKVNIVCDVDGNTQTTDSFLKKLKEKCRVKSEFKFKRDFENSIPPKINLEAINKYLSVYKSTIKSLQLEDIETCLSAKKPYIKALEEKLSISIDKVKLASLPVPTADIEYFYNIISDINNKDKNLVATIDGKVVGVVMHSTLPSGNGDIGVFIDRQYRGKGIGTTLLKELISKTNNTLEVTIFSKNRSRNMYKKCGFVEVGAEEKHFFDKTVYLPIQRLVLQRQ